MKDPEPDWDAENLVSFRDPAFRRVLGEQWRGPEKLDMAGMTTREEEEFLLHYGTRTESKALKQRRKAEKQAVKTKKRLFRR